MNKGAYELGEEDNGGNSIVINWIKRYLCSLRQDLKILVVLDIACLLFMELVLRRIPAPFPIFVKIGDLFVALAISFLASVIFYFVQVHMPREKEKADLFPLLASQFRSILGSEKEILTRFLGLSMDEMTEDAIDNKAGNLDLYSDAPLILGDVHRDHKANWIEYGLFEVNRIDKNWDMMIRYSAYLDSECMALLNRMQSPGSMLDLIRKVFPMCKSKAHAFTFGNGSERIFLDFWQFIQEQENYYNRVFKPYENNSGIA